MPISGINWNSLKSKYLFIDGGCLRQFVKQAGEWCPNFSIHRLDWGKVTRGYSKAFFYDAPPIRANNEAEDDYNKRLVEMDNLFNELRSTPNVHVYEGDTRRRRKVVQQKKVDIMIAVDMLMHSYRRNMEEATLLTADLDFKPLIDALVQDGMHVELWYPQGKPNKELIYAADRRRPLTIRDILEWASNDYLDAHPQPQIFSQQGKDIKGGRLIDRMSLTNGDDAEVYDIDSGSSYIVLFPSRQNRDKGYITHIKHHDREFVVRYAQEAFDEFWDGPL